MKPRGKSCIPGRKWTLLAGSKKYLLTNLCLSNTLFCSRYLSTFPNSIHRFPPTAPPGTSGGYHWADVDIEAQRNSVLSSHVQEEVNWEQRMWILNIRLRAEIGGKVLVFTKVHSVKEHAVWGQEWRDASYSLSIEGWPLCSRHQGTADPLKHSLFEKIWRTCARPGEQWNWKVWDKL